MRVRSGCIFTGRPPSLPSRVSPFMWVSIHPFVGSAYKIDSCLPIIGPMAINSRPAPVPYEAAYNEARKLLHQRGKKVGRAYYGEDGLRLCPVGGLLLGDRDLLREAWGESLTQELLSEQSEIVPAPLDCPDCIRLWMAFCVATASYLKAFAESHSANRSSLEASAVLERAQRRRSARRSVLDHASMHRQYSVLG